MRYSYLLLFLVLGITTGCVGISKNFEAPEKLAKRQWQACSHYPTVEFVEVTGEGQLLVRDLHYSSPPVDFQRCLAEVAFKQVLSGKRDAKSLVREAYFVDTKPDREYLYKPSGHFPEEISLFSPDQPVYFFFVIDAPSNRQVRVSFEWGTPEGETIRTRPIEIPNKGAAARKWKFEQFIRPNIAKGRWSVRLFIEENEAGEYFFDIV